MSKVFQCYPAASMKLKQRLVFIPLVCALVFAFMTFFLSVSQTNVLGRLFKKPDPHFISVRDFEPQAPQLNAEESALLDNIKAHLPVPRRDLDLSNYSSNSDTHAQNSSNIHLNAYDLKQIVLHDDVIQENADTIIEIAHILEKTHPKADRTDEVVEQRGEAGKDQKDMIKQEGAAHERSDTDLPNEDTHRNGVGSNAIQIAPAFRPVRKLLPEDEVILQFELSPSIVQQLERYVKTDREMFKKHVAKTGRYLDVHSSSFTHSKLYHWEKVHNHISQYHLYDPSDRDLQVMMREMVRADLTSYYQDERGTQLKLIYTLSTRQQVMFKPMRYPREQETLPDHFYFSDFERHNAEIASFHLDKVLGFYRVPPTVGRRINVTYDVKRHAKSAMLKTFFVSPAGNICFHGDCDYYCDTGHAVCGHPDILEGSMQAYLPSSRRVKRKTWKHPWKRSYHKRNKADWEVDSTYCSKVRRTQPYSTGRRLLDLMDMAVFDFLTGNMDRHHYDTFSSFGNDTVPLLMDNGRAFGKSRHDELSILAPVYQCCLIRFSTLQTLLDFHTGPMHLSTAMRSSMADDVAQPVLLEPHFTALDRRVKIILKTVHKCIERNGYLKVVENDGF